MKKDCFAYGGVTKCLILKKLKCEGCPFYKTASQLKLERDKSRKRIESLNPQKQAYIADTYGNLKLN